MPRPSRNESVTSVGFKAFADPLAAFLSISQSGWRCAPPAWSRRACMPSGGARGCRLRSCTPAIQDQCDGNCPISRLDRRLEPLRISRLPGLDRIGHLPVPHRPLGLAVEGVERDLAFAAGRRRRGSPSGSRHRDRPWSACRGHRHGEVAIRLMRVALGSPGSRPCPPEGDGTATELIPCGGRGAGPGEAVVIGELDVVRHVGGKSRLGLARRPRTGARSPRRTGSDALRCMVFPPVG